MNMDFVQRNLINERNNLQIELAKAKLLIAELSEATNYNNSPNKDVKSKLSEFEQGRKANTAKPVGDKITKNPPNKPKPMSEEAEYISDLENVIIAIAEQLGVHPNDLLNEINVHINMRDTSTSGPYSAAAKEKSRGISDALLNDPSQKGVDARAAHRQAEQGRIDARAEEYKDHQRRMGGYPKPTGLG